MIKPTQQTVVISLIALYGCAWIPGKSWPEKTGTLIDRSTNKPISGAIVFARWEGDVSVIADSQSVCYHIETTTTDKNGRYKLPSWTERLDNWNVDNKHISIKYFYPGYEDVGPPHELKKPPKDTGYMAPFFVDSDRTYRDQRLEYLKKYNTSCYTTDGSGRNVLPLLEAIYEEGKSIATSMADHKLVCALKYYLEEEKINDKIARKNWKNCKEQYI